MDKAFKKKQNDGIQGDNELRDEPHFSAEDFTQEIEPLLNDYFRGEFKFDGQNIICSFANGQKFRVKAEEI